MHSIRRRASDEDEHRKASWLIRFVWLSPVLPGWAVNPPLLAQERDSMRFSSASNPSHSRPAHDSGKNLTEGPSPPAKRQDDDAEAVALRHGNPFTHPLGKPLGFPMVVVIELESIP